MMWKFARRLSMFLLALLLACSSLSAFPRQPTSSAEATAGATQEAEAQAEGLKTVSGTLSQSPSTASAQGSETEAKLAEGKKLTKDESAAVLAEIEAIRADLAALRAVSVDKDKVIAEQADAIKRLGRASGTKWGVMAGAGAHVADGGLAYGLGVDGIVRLGDHVLLDVGVSYDIGGPGGIYSFDAENLGFSVKAGWMF